MRTMWGEWGWGGGGGGKGVERGRSEICGEMAVKPMGSCFKYLILTTNFRNTKKLYEVDIFIVTYNHIICLNNL